MRRAFTLGNSAALLAAIAAVLPFVHADELHTLVFDPVHFVKGQKVEGHDTIKVDRGRFTYQFVDEKSKAEFLADPEKYEIQLGGACARMGPLSGDGRLDILDVYDGRLYVFASRQCRETFRKAPLRLLEKAEPRPNVTPEAARHGRQLLERAMAAVGGAEKLDSVRTISQRASRKSGPADQPTEMTRILTIRPPDAFRVETTWGAMVDAKACTDASGFFSYAGENWAMVGCQAEALRREFSRFPLVILLQRQNPGLVCVADGCGTIGGLEVEQLIVHINGATSVLGLDPDTDRVVATRSLARGGQYGYLGQVERIYTEFREAGGLMLPHSWRVVRFDGEPVEAEPTNWNQIDVNPDVPASVFVMP